MESWSTELRPTDSKGTALHATGDDTADAPEPPRARVRQRAPLPTTSPGQLTAAVRAACNGDEAAFVMLWRTLHPALLRYLRVRGEDLAEDIAAETWIHVVRGLATFEGNDAEFRAWLFTIARHRAIDQSRTNARRPATIPVADPARMEAHPMVRSAEDDAVANDDTARALGLVATLPPDQAEAVMLRVVAGLDVADVARLLDKKPGTVRVMVHRALRALARDTQPPSAREVV